MSGFDVPIVVFLYKRKETTLRVLGEIAKVSPSKIYLIGDGARAPEDEMRVRECRDAVESYVSQFDCEIIRNYSESNRGVYSNIAGGARWVFEREAKAIFLEDDTIPDVSFFPYAAEMLARYENDDKVLWVCGTNYLGSYKTKSKSDYLFTQHMLPCGWASWAEKFNLCYDGDLELFDRTNIERIESLYESRRLYRYDIERIAGEYRRKVNGEPYMSWDYQMAYSLRVHDKYGTVPRLNLILNVGDDVDSTHGGTSGFNTMTRRFCRIPTCSLEFPLKHPSDVVLDRGFEARTARIVLPPSSKLRRLAVLVFKRAFSVPANMTTREALHRMRLNGLGWRKPAQPEEANE